MIKTIIFLILFLVETFYIKYIQERNSLNKKGFFYNGLTISGGGIIFIPAIIFYLIFFKSEYNISLINFLIATLILAGISFVDDLKPISPKTRLIFHFIATTITFFTFDLNNNSSLIISCLIFSIYTILSIGFTNIYNFMDGINGMSFLNALSCYITLYFINNYLVEFTDDDLISIFIIATLVFGFFNFRKKPKCFLGDVGSITIGFTIIIFTIKLFAITKNPFVFLVIGVYSLDGGWTILERLFRKENIFKEHFRHLYEIAAFKFNISHLQIAFIYFLVQVVLNVSVYYFIETNFSKAIHFIIIFLFLSLVYFFIKKSVYKKVK